MWQLIRAQSNESFGKSFALIYISITCRNWKLVVLKWYNWKWEPPSLSQVRCQRCNAESLSTEIGSCSKLSWKIRRYLIISYRYLYSCDILNSHEEYFSIQYPPFFDMRYSIQRQKKYFRRRLKQQAIWGILELQKFLPFCNFKYSFPW